METSEKTTAAPAGDASKEGGQVAVISYLTLIGWIIALIMHNNNKTELGAFHIRQMLGIVIVGFATGVLINILVRVAPSLYSILSILYIPVVILWVMGVIGAANKKMKPVPIVGESFQKWFKGLG